MNAYFEDGRCKAVQEPAKKTKEQLSPKFHVYAVGVALTPGNFTVDWSSSNYLNGAQTLITSLTTTKMRPCANSKFI